jgi:hypothetical protein
MSEPLPKMAVGSLHLEFRRCGRPNCRGRRGLLHGPYLVRRWREKGRQRINYKHQERKMRKLAIALARVGVRVLFRRGNMKHMSLTLALGGALALVLAALAVPMDSAEAGERHHGAYAVTHNGGGYAAPRRPRLTLRYVWGPAKMPPPPMDFGPHFDFPPEPLNGGLTHDPYPN